MSAMSAAVTYKVTVYLRGVADHQEDPVEFSGLSGDQKERLLAVIDSARYDHDVEMED